MDTFYVIDGHSQIYQAFFARMQELTAPNGEPVKATYVFTRALMKLLREKNPTYIVMAADGDRRDLHRRKLYPEYKANRGGEKPEGLGVQISRIVSIVRALGIPVIYCDGYEADDVIATLVTWAEGVDDLETVIVSKDKDLQCLLSPSVKMYQPQTDTWTTHDDAVARWGVPPCDITHVQTLCGDSTDNIPGVKGIGEKRAVELIQKYGSVDGVFENIDALTPALRANLIAARDTGVIELTRQLVSLSTNIPLSFDPDSLEWRGLDLKKVRPIFRLLGFKRWLK